LIDVRRLRLLRALASHGTVAATAQAMHLTGPAVSQQLAALERDARLPLLEKQGRGLRLTAAGQLLVEHADVILASLAAAEADLQALRGGGLGVVRVAAFPSAARALLPAVWRDLASQPGPAPGLRLVEQEPDQAIAALRRGNADLAVVHAYSLLPREVPPAAEQHQLLDDPVLAALSPGLAARLGLGAGQPVPLAALAAEDWLLPGPETSCHELTRRACGAAGFVPRGVALASDFSVITALVATGAGTALVPRMALPEAMPDIRLHPLAEPVMRTITALTAAGEARQPAISQVLGSLRAAAAAIALRG
jgi:DNA-binding transcriptional LysR family regulator